MIRYCKTESIISRIILEIFLTSICINQIFAQEMKNTTLLRLSNLTFVKTAVIDRNTFLLESAQAEDYLIDWEKEIYILKNNNVIYQTLDGTYQGWFSSLEDLKKVMLDLPNRRPVTHFFEGFNPYKKDFPIHTNKLINNLLVDLNLESSTFIINEEGLKQIEEAVNSQEDPQMFMINHLLSISALVGEVFLKTHSDTSWYMDRDSDGETWLPMIKVKKSEQTEGSIQFVLWIYESIKYYNGDKHILHTAYLSLIDFYGLGLLDERKK
jgi:hypothetical protein